MPYLLQNRYGIVEKLCKYKQDDSRIFLGIEIDTERKVLIKTHDKVEEEAERLAKLDHPRIPKFIDLIQENGKNFLVAEWIEGSHTLEKELMRFGVFDQYKLRNFLREMLGVLNYIHQNRVVHGDITLQNIIWRHSDKTPFLVDFENLDGRGQSVAYIAPEVWDGIFCEVSDIYSLGAVSLVLICGNYYAGALEFFDPKTHQWRWREYLFADNPIGEFEARILDRMIAPRLKDRYQSVDEVVNDFGFYSLRSR